MNNLISATLEEIKVPESFRSPGMVQNNKATGVSARKEDKGSDLRKEETAASVTFPAFNEDTAEY
jgi:hypothetical protein